MDAKLKMNNILRINEELFFHVRLRFAPIWAGKPNEEYIREKI